MQRKWHATLTSLVPLPRLRQSSLIVLPIEPFANSQHFFLSSLKMSKMVNRQSNRLRPFNALLVRMATLRRPFRLFHHKGGFVESPPYRSDTHRRTIAVRTIRLGVLGMNPLHERSSIRTFRMWILPAPLYQTVTIRNSPKDSVRNSYRANGVVRIRRTLRKHLKIIIPCVLELIDTAYDIPYNRSYHVR